MSRRTILGFSFFPAYLPPRSGGVERLFRVYSLLSESFDVKLISSGEVGGDLEIVEHSACFTEYRVPKGSEFLRAYEDLQPFSGDGDLSGPAVGVSCKTLGALHEIYLSHYATADVLIHDSPFLIECDLFRGFDQKIRVYNSYNCEADLYASFHSTSDQTSHIEKLVADFEGDLCRNADLITTCSEEDRQRFKQLFDPIAPIEIVPNGVMPIVREEAGDTRSGNRLVFIGSNHKPNVEAAKFIIDELAAAYPRLEFHLVGSCHEPFKRRNIVAHGVVDAAAKADLLRSARAAINPIVSGGGSSLKVADIVSSGTPLLSTKLGVRGFDLDEKRHYVALSKKQFLSGLERVLADDEKLSRFAVSARRHIVENYAWTVIAAKFSKLLMALPNGRRRQRPYLVINDYDSLNSTGGGGTRTAGLCRGLAESRPVIFMSFAEGAGGRQVSPDGRILSLTAPKTDEHVLAQKTEDKRHWISTADILNYRFAPENPLLTELFRCAASVSQKVICEHVYMVSLPRLFGIDFVHSSHNFELGLKTDLLRQHPYAQDLLTDVREAEAFSCAASFLTVAVSQEDARQLTGTYRFSSPTFVVRNGSDAPADLPEELPASSQPSAIFMGSGHGPNVDAAQWIVESLAPAMPEVQFRLLGSVSDTIAPSASSNVTALGIVSAEVKAVELLSSTVALNPIQQGSGSNIKVADYLQHGLPVLTTTFGSRGYEDIPAGDLRKVGLNNFSAELSQLLKSHRLDGKERMERAVRYREKLSMVEGGRHLHALIEQNSGERRRALYVTYRYNDPPLGGGEFYVDRLVGALAKEGWFVDVVSPEVVGINDIFRFGAEFSGDPFQPVTVGTERVRSAKFPADGQRPDERDLKHFWNAQPYFEEHFVRALPKRPNGPALAWGWGDPQERNRWCFVHAGFYSPISTVLSIEGRAPARAWLELLSDEGELVHQIEIDGEFQLHATLPAGFTRLRVNFCSEADLPDPRPLALLIDKVSLDTADQTYEPQHALWKSLNGPLDQYAAYSAARRAARDPFELRLSSLRDPSSSLVDFIAKSIDQYDLLITHNAIFGSTTNALRIADEAGVPSILVPHLHLDDDFYHFTDVLDACRQGSRTLVCPSSTAKFLADEGMSNVSTLTPGIDVSEPFSAVDAEAFRKLLGREDDFVLVLGRKARAKGYSDVISSVNRLSAKRPLVVMIGPDDDGLPLPEGDVIYLGQQPREILRGALMECLALVNMSRSESFGIVLLEAGLARKPVLANRNCAAFADLVEDGVNGLLAGAEDLHLKLTDLIADKELRARLGAEGHKKALAYDWVEIERRFTACCNEVVRA